jgi:MinD superfamily P-loop ATPase
MEPREAGEWYVSDIANGKMVHAALFPGEENSGKLVSIVRERAKKLAEERKSDFVIIDGPPGTGCSVIATLSGVDLAVIVTEPTLSGIHDMERVLELSSFFSVKPAVVINKFDVNREKSIRIREYCDKNDIPFFGTIPYSKKVVDSVSEETPYVSYSDDGIAEAIRSVWEQIMRTVNGD